MWHCQSFCCCREYLNVSWDYVGGDSCSKLFKWFTNGIHGKNGGEIKLNRNKLSTTIHLDLWPYSTVQQLGIKYAYNLLGELWDLKEKCVYLSDIYLYCFCAYFTLSLSCFCLLISAFDFFFTFWFRSGFGFVYNVQWMRCSSFWVLSKNKIPQRAHIAHAQWAWLAAVACACVCLCLSLILIIDIYIPIFIYRLVLRVNPWHASYN